ncbi:hypothetical protein DRP04_14260, partial [Archaeoglobales archaeon]
LRELKGAVEELKVCYLPYYGLAGVLKFGREKLGEKIESIREHGVLTTLRQKTHILPTEVEYEYEREEKPGLLDRIKSVLRRSPETLEAETTETEQLVLEEVKEEVKETIPEHLKSSSAFKKYVQMKAEESSPHIQLRGGV